MKFRIKGAARQPICVENEGDDEAPRVREPLVRLMLKLHHGDIVVMDGAAIQSVWEVSSSVCERNDDNGRMLTVVLLHVACATISWAVQNCCYHQMDWRGEPLGLGFG